MSIESYLITFGYIALFIGTFLEGETVLIIAGFLAHRGYLSLSLVALVAFLGSFSGDQFFFYIGRTGGQAFLNRRPHLKHRAQRVRILLERYSSLIVLCLRFLYGLRVITAVVVGISGFRARRFFVLNALSAIIWATMFAWLGYAFGQLLESILTKMRYFELWTVLGIALVGSVICVYHYKTRIKSLES
jgi:membrane protein DedA with SNARE-associated domain